MMKTRFFTRSQKEKIGGGNSAGILTNSERSAMLTDSDRSAGIDLDIDIDFSVTESGRTVAHIVNSSGVDHDGDDGLDFSITSSGRTIEHIMQEQQQAAGKNAASKTAAAAGQPIVPAVTATISNPLTIPTTSTAESAARPIPNAATTTRAGTSRHGSEDSSGSAFLSGILNNTNNLSHTPPTAFGTSYENKHFGKRQRSGSVSGRLRSASDLEEKGLIDRQQKGILKDLIICGDEELQQALDQYEAGNPSVLETMIRSGALQNKAVPDLDLLGDLDLDFLTVHDDNMIGQDQLGGNSEGPGMYTLPQQQPAHPGAPRSASLPSVMGPPPSFPSKRHASDVTHNNRDANPGLVSPEYDDGIGELEFTGDHFEGSAADTGYYGTSAAATVTTEDPQQEQQQSCGQNASSKQRTRTFSSLDDNDNRLRSNSLFSALINDPRATTAESQELGRWMDRVPPNDQNTTLVTTDDGPHQPTTQTRRATISSKPIAIPDAKLKPSPTKKKPGRRKSDSAVMDRKMRAKLKQEAAELKRREKQEKRELREREKQEKREARLAAKEEKKRLKEKKKEAAAAVAMEEDEKPAHIPGSGRPRSMSDPSFRAKRDEFGLVEIERPDGWVGAYSPESRKVRIEKFLAKRHQRVWTKTVKYDVRKNFADSRLRVKGRFVKKEDEMLMRDLMSMT